MDTGSKVSVIPYSLSKCKGPPDKFTLTAVNETPISTYDKHSLTIIFVFIAGFHGFSLLPMYASPSQEQTS